MYRSCATKIETLWFDFVLQLITARLPWKSKVWNQFQKKSFFAKEMTDIWGFDGQQKWLPQTFARAVLWRLSHQNWIHISYFYYGGATNSIVLVKLFESSLKTLLSRNWYYLTLKAVQMSLTYITTHRVSSKCNWNRNLNRGDFQRPSAPFSYQ